MFHEILKQVGNANTIEELDKAVKRAEFLFDTEDITRSELIQLKEFASKLAEQIKSKGA